MNDTRTTTLAVPFADLHQQYISLKRELDEAISAVISDSAFIRGKYVDRFEKEFATALGVDHFCSCANGTDALYIAMKALNVVPGDEVIVPAMSWISTSETVTQAGAKVVFCDVNPVTFTIDTEQIGKKITPKTVGIIPVHLYGQPADMDSVMAISKEHNLWVLEDCAQAHLAKYKGKIVGSIGSAGTFSFYPGKNLGAMGDAGGISTNDGVLAERMVMFARHGGLTKGDHQIEGINSRMDGLQGAILSVKLSYLAEWTSKRQMIAQKYTEMLSEVPGLDIPVVTNDRSHVWHLYVVRHDRRDELAAFLKQRNIQTAINYPVALPFLPAYKHLAHGTEDFQTAYATQTRILSLPIFAEMTGGQLETVVGAIKEFCQTN